MLASSRKVVLKVLLLLFILLNILNIESLAIVSQIREFYVNDYANLINSSTEQYIINANLNLYNQICNTII